MPRSRFLFVLTALATAACSPDTAGGSGAGPDSRAGPLTVAVSTSFLRECAMRIGGERVRVVAPVPADADPARWKPDRAAIRTLQDADLILLNGADFETWTQTAGLPLSKTVRTAQAFEDQWIVARTYSHVHGPEGAQHQHTEADGHTWMDPQLARLQAAAVRDALSARDPEGRSDFTAGFAAFDPELVALHERMAALDLEGWTLIQSHPAWVYPARRYGWATVKTHLRPDRVLDDHEATHLAIDHGQAGTERGVVLWETEPLPAKAAEATEYTGWPNLVWEPGENLGADRSWLETQRTALGAFERLLGGSPR